MKPKLNIVFCGSINDKTDKSWGKTNQYFLDHLKKVSNVVAVIDYRIKGRFLKRINKLISFLFFGGSTVRNPFMDFFMERNFEREMKLLQVKPDLVIHSNAICITEELAIKCKHVQYSDSALEGMIDFMAFKPSKKSLKVFRNETSKYIGQLSKIYTFNEWTKKTISEKFNVPETKLKNIGFGANLIPFTGEKNYENNLILTVLRKGTEKEKGLDLLLEGFKRAKKTNDKLKLAVVGTRGESIDGVVYYENYPREKTVELFHQASLFAMPAMCEPNGMVYIEALACKTPILGLNRLAFPEFCDNGQFGFICEENPESVSKSILNAFVDLPRLKEMGIKGQRFVIGKYNWNEVVKKIISDYEDN